MQRAATPLQSSSAYSIHSRYYTIETSRTRRICLIPFVSYVHHVVAVCNVAVTLQVTQSLARRVHQRTVRRCASSLGTQYDMPCRSDSTTRRPWPTLALSMKYILTLTCPCSASSSSSYRQACYLGVGKAWQCW